MELLSETFQLGGEILIGLTAIMVHRRFWKEHKIDDAVYKEMKREQLLGIFGILLLAIGYTIRIIWLT